MRVPSPVTTWGGERSLADIEAEKEERQRNRKSWSERYDEDIDRGKVISLFSCIKPNFVCY